MIIAIEGPDGSGKTTQVDNLRNYLEQEGFNVILARNPGGTPLAELIRGFVLTQEDLSTRERLLGMLTALASTSEEIGGQLRSIKQNKKIVVLLDRWILSTLIYQGLLPGVSIFKTKAIIDHALEGIVLKPDFYVVFKVSPSVAWDRMDKREEVRTVFERKDSMAQVAVAYQFANSLVEEPVISIDADQSLDKVWTDTKDAVLNFINLYYAGTRNT